MEPDNCAGGPSQVGSYPAGASPYGALDMAGNVWEWVNDWWDDLYYESSPASNPTGPTAGLYKVMRGGAYGNFPHSLRVSNRWYDIEGDGVIGFRCAR